MKSNSPELELAYKEKENKKMEDILNVYRKIMNSGQLTKENLY